MEKIRPLEEGMNQCSVYFTEEKEESYEATATHSHWVNYSRKNGSPSENFADFTEGNEAKAFLGGKAYFAELLNAFNAAQKTIYITGWQVNWDAQLAEGVRLVDALLEQVKSKPQLKVYIMPWKNVQVQTYARATERVFAALNVEVGWEAFYVRLAGEQSDQFLSSIFFSHHQKCVVVDESVAFIGGIDLAYGRYDEYNGDDGGYELKADAEGRHGLNMYNSCIRYIEPSKESGSVDTVRYDPMYKYIGSSYEMLSGDPTQMNLAGTSLPDVINRIQYEEIQRIISAVKEKHQWQSPDEDDNEKDKQGKINLYHYLDATVQPRMPWQDYHIRIRGPTVDDLVRNFVLRWNSYKDRGRTNALQTIKPYLQCRSGYHSPKAGSCQIQVLRSAALDMRRLEFNGSISHGAEMNTPSMAQHDILKSMLLLISKAEHYIYIENQFFVSAFGSPSVEDLSVLSDEALEIVGLSAGATKIMPGNSDALPVNQIAEWLGDRIKHSIYACVEQPFHVCIVLPVHPEGRLDEASTVAQVHLTRQSLVFGTKSLLNRVRQTLWVRQKLDGESRANWADLISGLEKQCEAERRYEEISFEACAKYVTLLNLRAHDNLYGIPVTEQVYVHSKLMVVDDRYVLVGSANINERSLLGNRDSELAVLIADTEGGYQDIDGSGVLSPYRKFARDLRINIWKKLLGDAVGEFSDFLQMPAKAEGWQQIRKLALNNTRYYEDAFDFIPQNYLNDIKRIISMKMTKKVNPHCCGLYIKTKISL
ncbi:phospholipase [Citrobacter freundii]|jgi:phospholipase D1/2|uniref:phospholipase D-like domain-containing protein n=1 Tax=Citrobacter freundii TaxID=546 RepID=UPI0015E9E14A|nr:phospholipase D-like domain-containing protein [Citrobacter freundii]QLY71045.1 phospholipase [Citrobacter freundii]